MAVEFPSNIFKESKIPLTCYILSVRNSGRMYKLQGWVTESGVICPFFYIIFRLKRVNKPRLKGSGSLHFVNLPSQVWADFANFARGGGYQGGAQHKSMVHNTVLYSLGGAQRRSHKPSPNCHTFFHLSPWCSSISCTFRCFDRFHYQSPNIGHDINDRGND